MPRRPSCLMLNHAYPVDGLPRALPADASLPHATWRDARGVPLAQAPHALLPSATILIVESVCTMPWRLVAHQRQDNGWWGMPGGRMEIGESLLECARREAREETGLDIQIEQVTSIDSNPAQYACVAYPNGTIIQYVNVTFLATVLGGTLCRSSESRQVCWASAVKLPRPWLPAHQWRLEQARLAVHGTGVPVR